MAVSFVSKPFWIPLDWCSIAQTELLIVIELVSVSAVLPLQYYVSVGIYTTEFSNM